MDAHTETILEAKIGRLVFGARHYRVGRKDLGDYSVVSFLALVKRDLDVVSGVREPECERLRNTWTAIQTQYGTLKGVETS